MKTKKIKKSAAPKFNTVQQCAIVLMQDDLRFIATIMQKRDKISSNYIVAMLPFMGVIVDGVEDWICAFNRSSKGNLLLPTFTPSEKIFYEKMRSSIKLFENGFVELDEKLKTKYEESDQYFASCCKPFARKLRLYHVFGVLHCNGVPCDNTVLDQCFVPDFQYGKNDKELLKNMAIIGGKYARKFNAISTYTVNSKIKFTTKDFGGLAKIPWGDDYSSEFLLFSILCQIDFVIFAIDQLIEEEISTKLRFAYILYYYLLKLLPDINAHLNCNFSMSGKYNSDEFRNAMAHYKLGVAISENELVFNDLMFGLTNKFFGEDYYIVKQSVIEELKMLSEQIKSHLGLQYDFFEGGENIDSK